MKNHRVEYSIDGMCVFLVSHAVATIRGYSANPANVPNNAKR